MNPNLHHVLSLSEAKVLDEVHSDAKGLTNSEVTVRHKQYGLNLVRTKKLTAWTILWRQLTGNPLVIILAIATSVAYALGQHTSAYYIFIMILASIGLGFWNEYAAVRTVQDLLKKVSLSAIVTRDEEKQEIPVEQLTIGDIVLLAPGSIIPADMRFIESGNLEVDESPLTGESKTVYKIANAVMKEPAGLSDFANIGFMGTTVTSGWAKGVVLAIGRGTEFGKIAKAASFVKPETDFQKGLRDFGNLIVRVILILTTIIFVINTLLGHPFIDSLLFALAIAVGLTPELLPIIVTISLSHGAGKLAREHVISKQLISIENLGNMDILCTDKTGTLTEGVIKVVDAIDPTGAQNPRLFMLGIVCNSAIHHHKIIGNAIDVAFWTHAHQVKLDSPQGLRKVSEEPFDYERRAMFSVVQMNGVLQLIAKGSPEAILLHCTKNAQTEDAQKRFEDLGRQGLRIVAFASREIEKKATYSWDDMKEMDFEGFVTMVDTPKSSAKASILKLEKLGVQVKIITGDSELVTERVCREINIAIKGISLGAELERLEGEALRNAIANNNIFARVTPSQKLLIIQELRKQGHVVGFMGDGINDVLPLHSADVGISVNTAVDVARDAASVVLLRKGLDVIAKGVIEGRRTFSNTIKYILMGTSSNFGNMFSAAGASFFLPFLPMTPSQILLNNALYDLSQISIPTDNVDEESLRKPRHWNIKSIKYYMLFFGPLSSIYDFLTFGIMIFVFHASDATFQTGWFVESIATQVLVVFIIRTSRKFFLKSRPGSLLILTCLGVTIAGVLLPFSPLSRSLGFVPLPPLYFVCLIGLVGTYLGLVATLKSVFLKKFSV